MATAEQPDSTSVAMEQVSTEEAKATNEEANRGTSPAAEAAAEATGPASEAAAVADAAVTESSCDDDRSNGSSSRDEDTDDDETETTEESPCGRWLKRREEIKYRDVPGIDTAFLAMDSEEGVEVVWNEAQFSSSKKFKAQEEKLRSVFDALTKIEHANIVHFHHYWLDPGSGGVGAGAEGAAARQERKLLPRLIFITEYMSSGSLKQFLRKTKKNNRKIQLQSWKRWSTQILYALR
jgi:nuclear receptor-binding protein